MSNEMIVNKPGFLSTNSAKGMDKIGQYAKPPRIKIVQALTGPPIKPTYKEGDIIVNPQLIKLGDTEHPFSFTPIYMFVSWSCMNPIQMKGQLSAFRGDGMVFDPNHDIAKKAKRFIQEPCPENPKFNIRYNELLNFFIMVHDVEEVKDMPILMFFVRGEYKTGQFLIGLLQSRGQCDIFAGRYRAFSEPHTGTLGTWQGLKIMNDLQPWVDEEQYRKYNKLYDDLEKLVQARQVNMSEFTDDELPNSEEF